LLSRRLMGASSYLCLALLLGRPAPALAGNTDPPPAIFDNASAAFREHWFFSLEGGYAANASPSNLGFSPSDPYLSYLSPLRPGAGGGFVGGTIGHTMGPEWDAALSYRATLFGKSSENAAANLPAFFPVTSSTLAASASSGLWYQTFDGRSAIIRRRGWRKTSGSFSVRAFSRPIAA
jgi:3',5'-cyclic AMP phosphodiesterase CpdA